MKLNNRFGGIYAKDELTTDIIKPNRFYIINLDGMNSITNGTHWTCFYYRNKIEYFDSYGLKPLEIIAQNYSFTYNNRQFQSHESKASGYYCLYLFYHRYHGLSYFDIIKTFSLVDLEYNPQLNIDFFNNYN